MVREWCRRRFISDCPVSRCCCDQRYRHQSPSRDGSRALLSPKISDFRDDENSRTTRRASPLGVAFGAASRQRAVARWRHRPLRCLLRRASPHRETASPEPPFAPLTGIAAAPFIPTHPHGTAGRRSGLPAVAGCRAATPEVPLAGLTGPQPHASPASSAGCRGTPEDGPGCLR